MVAFDCELTETSLSVFESGVVAGMGRIMVIDGMLVGSLGKSETRMGSRMTDGRVLS